jgi:hypothetical protein
MRNIKIVSVSVALLTLFSSCKKEFLNLTPYNALPIGQAVNSEANMYTAVNGMYASMRSANLYGRTLPIKGDLMADNTFIKPSNSGRYLDFNQYDITTGNANANGVWSSAYAVIKNANLIINADLAANTNINQMRGEAFATRALMYFELVRNFAKPYTVDPDGLGVPIVKTFNTDSLPKRNTTKEVYKLILDDLDQAFTLVTFNLGTSLNIPNTTISRTTNSSYFTKYAVRALQAKVYLHMGDWANAKTAALDVINNSGVTIVSNANFAAYWKNPTPRTDKVETLFEISSDAVGNNGTNSLYNFYDPNGYGDAVSTTNLYNTYTATDVRKALIVPSGGYLVVQKYPNINNAADKDDNKILRISDVILILAEAYARTNDEPNALLRLNQVAKNRDAGFAGFSSTGAQLITDIVNERRKELAFEGDRFFDLQRLNLPITKVKGENPLSTINVAPGDYRRIFPIPQAEVDANPNIRSQQNPGYL